MRTMILSAGCVFAALSLSRAEPTAEPEATPYEPLYAYAWSRSEPVPDNIYPFVWLKKDSLDPAAIAREVLALPPGRRALFSWDLHRDLLTHPKDVCRTPSGEPTTFRGVWWNHGTETVRQRFDDFFRRFKEAGGVCDAFILDFEDGMSNWELGGSEKAWPHYQAIQNDPRFPKLAKLLGFDDLRPVCFWSEGNAKQKGLFLKWNSVMGELRAASLNRAIYGPLRKYFPTARMSNYGDYRYRESLAVPNGDGHDIHRFGNGTVVGTSQSQDLYGTMRQLAWRSLDGQGSYSATAFNAFRLEANRMRAMVLSSPIPVQPWISHKQFAESLSAQTDLYQELIFHIALCRPEFLLLWNPLAPKMPNADPAHYAGASQDQLVSDCLKQLDGLLAGPEPRNSLVKDLIPWGDPYVLTGRLAGTRSVWRLTRDPDFDLEGVPPVEQGADGVRFRFGGFSGVIPGGKIYKPKKGLSELGWWIVAPTDAHPVLIRPGPKG
jgi:hypothetical protein